jgi:adenylate kinase family enzyme
LAKKLQEDVGAVRLTTSKALRLIVESNSTLGKKVKKILHNGEILTDDIYVKVFKMLLSLLEFSVKG